MLNIYPNYLKRLRTGSNPVYGTNHKNKIQMSVQQLISKPYAPIMEIIEVYGIAFETFNKYVSESKVKIIKRGKKCTYKTADVHLMLSERGYPKIRKPKKAPAATEA